MEELTQVFAGMNSGSAPGIDGLLAEFCVEFWGLFGPELVHVLESSLLHGELPRSLRRAVMSLLPNAGDLRHMKNWTPVSLLCTDYEILSKSLANRLTKVIGDLVHPDQSYCIPDISRYDNIFCRRDLMEGNCVQIDFGLIFLNFKKGFHSMDNGFLYHVLEVYGLENNFRTYIALLYHNISSIVKLNNELVSPMQVQRGEGKAAQSLAYYSPL